MVDLAYLPRSATTMSYTKTQRLIDEITRRIETGELEPGDQLPRDEDLRAEFGVSQMVIRTAMERLRDHVVSVPGKGRFVAVKPNQSAG